MPLLFPQSVRESRPPPEICATLYGIASCADMRREAKMMSVGPISAPVRRAAAQPKRTRVHGKKGKEGEKRP